MKGVPLIGFSRRRREALAWLRSYTATLTLETFRLGVSKVLPSLKLPDVEVADWLLAGVLAAYMRRVLAWEVSEERQRRIWRSAQALIEEQSGEALEVSAAGE